MSYALLLGWKGDVLVSDTSCICFPGHGGKPRTIWNNVDCMTLTIYVLPPLLTSAGRLAPQAPSPGWQLL